MILEAGPKTAARVLREVPDATLYRHASDGADVRFPVTAFDAVAAIAKPRKRRKLSPERREALIQAGAQYRLGSRAE